MGSGKSTVAKIFSLLGVPVYDADQISKSLYETDVELMQQVKRHFGEDVYTGEKLNRQKLASLVFNHPEKLALLNSLVHPLTIRHAEEWMRAQTAPYVIKEAALIFESGSAAGLDAVIGVSAPEELRIQRAKERDHLTRQDVINRMRRQIDEDMKMKLCDFIIFNDETRLVIPQVLVLDKKLKELSAVTSKQ